MMHKKEYDLVQAARDVDNRAFNELVGLFSF